MTIDKKVNKMTLNDLGISTHTIEFDTCHVSSVGYLSLQFLVTCKWPSFQSSSQVSSTQPKNGVR